MGILHLETFLMKVITKENYSAPAVETQGETKAPGCDAAERRISQVNPNPVLLMRSAKYRSVSGRNGRGKARASVCKSGP